VGSGFSFERVNARDYDELRPDYAPEAVAWVAERGGLGPGSVVVDLAAGTGQLSKRFVPLGVDVVAVEPASNMREVIRHRLPEVRVLEGTAEAIPLGDASAQAVVVGNAFHHFDADRAFAEIHRVVRAGGALAIFWAWHTQDGAAEYPALERVLVEIQTLRDSSSIATAYRSWERPPARVPGFTPFERAEFPIAHVIASARLADLHETSSDVASMPPDVRTRILDPLRAVSAELPETLRLPGRTVVDLCVCEGHGYNRRGT
jgi:SAM-dependent methyltransferase